MIHKKRYITILASLVFLVMVLVGLLIIRSGVGDANEILTQAEKVWLRNKGSITFISQSSYPPFEFVVGQGRRQGMCLELANWIATEFGFKARFIDTTFLKAQQALLTQKADVLTSFFFSRKRDRSFDFTSVMWEVPAMIFVRSERPDILGIEQLKGKRIAIQKGDYAKEFLAKKMINYSLISCNSFAEAVQLVINGSADAVIGDEQIVLYHIYSNRLTDKIKRVGNALYVGKNCMGVKEGASILLSILNKGIRLARNRGIFQKINQKWLGTHYKDARNWLQRNYKDLLLVFVVFAVLMILVVIWNIQLRHVVKRRSRQLVLSEEKYRTFFESAHDAIVLHDINGQIFDVNKTMLSMYNVKTKKDVLRMNFAQDFFKLAGGFSKLKKAWKKVINGATQEMELDACRPMSGQVFPINISMKKISLEKEFGILSTIKDLTVQKKAEQALVQAQKMDAVGTLAGGLAHDFNNVLGGILGPISIIQNSLKHNNPLAEEKLSSFIELVRLSSERASDIVTQLLTISKKQKLSLKTVDLNESVKQVIQLLRNSFDKAIVLAANYSDQPATISGDPAQIEQVLLNFLINASHALTIMRDRSEKWGGTIEVSIKKGRSGVPFLKQLPQGRKGNYWVVNILDSGVGMSQEVSSKIFDPFFTTKEKGQGTGLGLSMAFNIIEQHGGFVDCYSEPGIGTSFLLYFPVLLDEEKEVTQEEENIVLNGEGTILIVEDEDVLREIAQAMLQEFGYKTLVAADGEKAIKIFKKKHDEIDAVLLDMIMPKLSGRETYKKIKEIDPDAKVLLASGFKQDERIQEVLDMGADGFIQKPYTLEKLLESIRTLLG